MPHVYNAEVARTLSLITENIFNDGVQNPNIMLGNILSSYQFGQKLPYILATALHTDEEGLNALLANNALASGCDHHGGGEKVLQDIVVAARETGKYTHTFALKPEHWKETEFAKAFSTEKKKAKQEAEGKAEKEIEKTEAPSSPPPAETFTVKQISSIDEFLAAMGLRKVH